MREPRRIVVDWAEDAAARRCQARELGRWRASAQVETVLVDYEHGPTEETDPRTETFRSPSTWAKLALMSVRANRVPDDVRENFVSSYVERATEYYAWKVERLRKNQRALYGAENISANELGRFLIALPAEARVLTYRGARLSGDDVSFIENDEEELDERERP